MYRSIYIYRDPLLYCTELVYNYLLYSEIELHVCLVSNIQTHIPYILAIVINLNISSYYSVHVHHLCEVGSMYINY